MLQAVRAKLGASPGCAVAQVCVIAGRDVSASERAFTWLSRGYL